MKLKKGFLEVKSGIEEILWKSYQCLMRVTRIFIKVITWLYNYSRKLDMDITEYIIGAWL